MCSRATTYAAGSPAMPGKRTPLPLPDFAGRNRAISNPHCGSHDGSMIGQPQHLVEENTRENSGDVPVLRRARERRIAPRIRIPCPHHIGTQDDAAGDCDVRVKLEPELGTPDRIARAANGQVLLLQIVLLVRGEGRPVEGAMLSLCQRGRLSVGSRCDGAGRGSSRPATHQNP
jgi:hypothetical protein